MTAVSLRASRALGVGQALARESLPIMVCAAMLEIAAIRLPALLSTDGWLALVSGRLIAHDGIPHHDTLAVLTAAHKWVDQQWLGQLAFYGIEIAGGVRAVLAASVALGVGAFIAACLFARRRGGHPTTVGVVALLAFLPLALTTLTVRTQSLVYLPLVGLVAFLVRRSLTVVSVVALLVLLCVWANVHGSVLLAAGLVGLRGIVFVYESRRERRSATAGWLALLGAGPCLFASPYHLDLVSYYRATALNASFGRYLVEWAPTRFSPLALPLLLLVFGSAWMLGRAAGVYSLYERLLLVLAMFLGLIAVRQWIFSALILLMLAPVGFDRARRRRPTRAAPVLGAMLAAAAAVGAIVGAVHAVSAPRSDLTRNYPTGAADAAAVAAGQGRTVYATEEFGDWLVWEHPELAGRVVFDIRYELLDPTEFKRVVLFNVGSGVNAPLGRPGVFVLDPTRVPQAVDALRPSVRVAYKTDHTMVAVLRHAA